MGIEWIGSIDTTTMLLLAFAWQVKLGGSGFCLTVLHPSGLPALPCLIGLPGQDSRNLLVGRHDGSNKVIRPLDGSQAEATHVHGGNMVVALEKSFREPARDACFA